MAVTLSSVRSLSVAVCLAAVTGGCTASSADDDVSTATAPRPEPPPGDVAGAPVDALVFIDLSPSMDETPPEAFREIVSDVLLQLPPKATFSIRLLQSSNMDAKPLLADTIPNPAKTSDKIAANQQRVEWMDTFDAAVKRERKRKSPPPGLSCYVKSIDFASSYFESRARQASPGKTVIVWVGDLIEDCREPGSTLYGAWRTAAWRRGSAADETKRLPRVAQLTSTEVLAVIVPRSEEARREVDGAAVVTYWKEVLPFFGMAANHLRIGTPDVLQLGHGDGRRNDINDGAAR